MLFMYVAKGVCMCGLHTHIAVGMGMATGSARAPHRRQVREQCGGGRVKEESRAADALQGIRLCCCLLEKGVKGKEDKRTR